MFKIFALSLITPLCVASLCLSADTAEVNKETAKATLEQKKEVVKAPSLFFPEPRFEFDHMVDGAELTHDFVIMNKGTDTLQVQKVKTG